MYFALFCIILHVKNCPYDLHTFWDRKYNWWIRNASWIFKYSVKLKSKKPMKSKTIFLILLFVLTHTTLQGQTVVYTYNAQGSCTSRSYSGTPPKAKKAPNTHKEAKLLKVEVSPYPTFQDQLSISVVGLPAGHSLSYTMANISGMVIFSGSIGNGSTTLTTSALSLGTYIVKVSGDAFEESYKLLKN